MARPGRTMISDRARRETVDSDHQAFLIRCEEARRPPS